VREFDSYGGGEHRRFEATGYSRLERAEDRWWTADPDGGAFVTVGLNHADDSDLEYPHSAAQVRLRGGQGAWVGDRGFTGRTVPGRHRPRGGVQQVRLRRKLGHEGGKSE
jgi:hypothetical protein